MGALPPFPLELGQVLALEIGGVAIGVPILEQAGHEWVRAVAVGVEGVRGLGGAQIRRLIYDLQPSQEVKIGQL